MWLAPRAASELRTRVTDSARALRHRAASGYQQAGTRVEEVVDALTAKGQHVRDDVADAVARGADQVSRQATAMKTDRVHDTKKVST